MAGVEPPAAEPLDWKLRLRVVVQRLTQPTCACMVAMTAPAFVIWGETDTLTPLPQGRAIAALLPMATLHVLPATGHIPAIENPAAFDEALVGFLKTI